MGEMTFVFPLDFSFIHYRIVYFSYLNVFSAVVKIPILQHLEYLRDEELEERREKRRRQMAEEEESKQNERRASGAEQSREQSLQVVFIYLFLGGKHHSVSHYSEF